MNYDEYMAPILSRPFWRPGEREAKGRKRLSQETMALLAGKGRRVEHEPIPAVTPPVNDCSGICPCIWTRGSEQETAADYGFTAEAK